MKSAKKFDLMNSISWKNEFRSHEIRPPDPQSLLAVLANFPVQFNGKDGIGYPRPNKLNGKVGVSDQIWVCHWLISNRYPIGLGYLQKFSHWMPHAQPQYKLPQFDQLTFSQKKSLKLYIYIFFFNFRGQKRKRSARDDDDEDDEDSDADWKTKLSLQKKRQNHLNNQFLLKNVL